MYVALLIIRSNSPRHHVYDSLFKRALGKLNQMKTTHLSVIQAKGNHPHTLALITQSKHLHVIIVEKFSRAVGFEFGFNSMKCTMSERTSLHSTPVYECTF